MNIEIDKNKEEKTLSSQNVINKVLSCIGISRERTSTYANYSFDGGGILRLRVSDHGLFLQYWYDKNREARISGDNIPKLNIGQNLAITFSLTATECAERNIPYPQKIANKTAVKTEQGNNAKPQFTVRHICYFTDKLEETDINSIINALKKTISDGSLFEDPIHDNQKVAEWNDTSNCQPQKVQGDKHKNNQTTKNNNENINCNRIMKKNRIRLTESQLHRVIKESVNKVLRETDEQTLRIRPNFEGACDTIDTMLNKAEELRSMLQGVQYTDGGESELAMVHGELDDYISNFIMVLKYTKQRTKVNTYKR